MVMQQTDYPHSVTLKNFFEDKLVNSTAVETTEKFTSVNPSHIY